MSHHVSLRDFRLRPEAASTMQEWKEIKKPLRNAQNIPKGPA